MPTDVVLIDDLRNHVGRYVKLQGWVYNKRGSKGLLFLILRDGTGIAQCVVSQDAVDEHSWEAAEKATQESALTIAGTVKADDRQTGGVEIVASSVAIISLADEYPITNKEHGIEFLMNNRHLWLRSRRQWAVLRIRNRVAMAIHEFFQREGFLQLDAPIFTGNAVEGTTTLFGTDFFGETAYLTQSGQLHGEAMAMAFGKIYTFGPTFRAEKSKTRRHLSEFWMIEPEMAFYDLDRNMELGEDFLIYIVGSVLADCRAELEVLERETSVLERVKKPFPRLSYDDAVELLRSEKTAGLITERIQAVTAEQQALQDELEESKKLYGQARKGEKRRLDARFVEINKRLTDIEEDLRNFPSWASSAAGFEWGSDFGGSDETLLTWHFDRPIIVHRFPASIKAFYMKRDPDDDRLALGMDILAPEGYGEIIGGGERATDLDFLKEQIRRHGLPESAFDWYLDLRRYGSVPHSGFGLGLERMVAWMCGLHHIREAIPFPRLMGRLSP
ncbi:MAG TPA: asparagine--tRNA ligase [Rhodothermia bacterium]|nr:asparagine--tRNA ligase [Rhodothermia bacterium]